MWRRRLIVLGLAWVALLGVVTPTRANDSFGTALAQLTDSDFDVKGQAIQALTQSQDPRSLGVLQSLLDGHLYYIKANHQIVVAEESGDQYKLTDVVSSQPAGKLAKSDIKKIGIDNTLRTVLNDAIARLSLGSPDATVRHAAVKAMYNALTPDNVQRLGALADSEHDAGVLRAIHTALAIADIDSPERATRLAAIAALGGNIEPEARNRLRMLVHSEDSTVDTEVRAAATRALAAIDTKLRLYQLFQTVFFGLSLGSVLLLSAIGLAITFGVMGVINMAHGELMMIGAYTTYLIQRALPEQLELSLLMAIPAAFIVAGLFGVAIERGVIRFLYGRPLETLLATFGISLILQQLVRTTISAQNVTVTTPQWLSGSLAINDALSLTYNRLYILAFALLVFAGLQLVLKKTPLGLQVRAVAQNRAMARAMGVRSGWVDAFTFGLGSGIAGIAGVALSQLTNVGPNMGQSYIIDSFMVVVFGGVGNLWGTLVGALSLGVANKFLEPYAGAVLAKILVLVFIILFIQKRPRGLFPQRGRSAEA
ncbi:MAG: urea ABC transporter permease subunit UrtB [Gammaproteobacteria bacterium]